MFKEKVKNFIKNPLIFKKLEKYVFFIEKYNKMFNLTGFLGDQIWESVIYESLIIFDNKTLKNKNLADIGSGAGFPSVPIAILNNSLKITIIEPLLKRTKFLEIIKKELNLENLTIRVERAENSPLINTFDYVTARAVAPLRVLLEISHNLLKLEGYFLFPKGPKVFEEMKESTKIIKILNIKKLKIEDFNEINSIQNYLWIGKKTQNNIEGFPRKWNKIKKKVI
ncbi:MAG: 16S rRNA (guanine(527)-N(7))-methyltransferase RsmG [Mollicutes bacterium PWAP]|nr:16S rRNA (guanine(527)-N(7))-methyltransferase RsmG [Mollicutes bacterium PWAP]